MHPRYHLALMAFLLLLGACGRPEISVPASFQTTKQAGGDIADLLRAPPPPGQTVEIDAYHWVGWMNSASYALDKQGCPQQNTYLSDWAVPAAIQFPFVSYTNSSHGYPPAFDPWLIPIPTLTTLTLNATSSVLGSIGTPLPPTHLVIPGSLNLPHHGRLRGHIGDPAFAKCAHNDRIFVVDGVTAVYDNAPQNSPIEEPEGYRSWPQYHDSGLGYSFAYAPDWRVEALKEADTLSAMVVHTAVAPDFPISIRIHSGEIQIDRTDEYDPNAYPPFYRRRSSDDIFGQFNQDGIFVGGKNNGQNLFGLWVDRPDSSTTRTMTTLISAHDYTYEIAMTYPIGLRANQPLLDAYTLLLDRFLLDTPQEPSPTPPIKQAVGAGPFLSQEEVRAVARQSYNNTLELIEAKLVSEAEMRRLGSSCATTRGHPDGVWLLRARIIADGQGLTVLVGLNAKTGARLCTANEEMGTPLPTWIPDVIPTATLLPGYPAPSPQPPTLTPDLPYPKPAVTSP